MYPLLLVRIGRFVPGTFITSRSCPKSGRYRLPPPTTPTARTSQKTCLLQQSKGRSPLSAAGQLVSKMAAPYCVCQIRAYATPGKSSLTVRFVDGHFVESYYPTIENTFSKVIKYKGQEYATEIIDTAGQVRYQIYRPPHMAPSLTAL